MTCSYDLTRVQQLRKELHQHNHNYHALGTATVTDQEFDQLFRELQALEARHPELADPNSPTSRVGAKSTGRFAKVKHSTPMLSLENSFTAEEAVHRIVSQAGACDVVLEPKVDGLSCSISYVGGKLVKAVTRGDHEVGDDVTANVRTIKSVPLTIDYLKPIEVRGEVYLSKANFEKLNAELEADGEVLFANARNAAAGSLKQKDSAECAKRRLSFVAYQVVDPINHGLSYQRDLLEWLGRLGFQIAMDVDQFVVTHLAADRADLLSKLLAIFDTVRKALPFDTDGCVIKVNDLRKQQEIGAKTRAPGWATAYKYAAPKAVTKLLSVTYQVGRTGKITPVAELQPVNVDGATVRRATLNNSDYIEALGLEIGCMVELERAGSVIPRILRKVS